MDAGAYNPLLRSLDYRPTCCATKGPSQVGIAKLFQQSGPILRIGTWLCLQIIAITIIAISITITITITIAMTGTITTILKAWVQV